MKTALVGFTWLDFFSFVATEARARGSAASFSDDQKRAWLKDEDYVSVADENEARALSVDQIITREFVSWQV